MNVNDNYLPIRKTTVIEKCLIIYFQIVILNLIFFLVWFTYKYGRFFNWKFIKILIYRYVHQKTALKR